MTTVIEDLTLAGNEVRPSFRVLLADDHAMIRESLRRALEFAGHQVVAEACDGEQAVELAIAERPDVAVMDLSMPHLSGPGAINRIHDRVPSIKVMVLSMLSDEAAVAATMQAGARSYMLKECTLGEIVDAIERTALGERVLSPSIERAATSTAKRYELPVDIRVTKREEEVLRLLLTGVSLSEAANDLYISIKTLKNHLSSIYQKLSVHDRSQAVLKAVRLGIVTIE